MIQTIPRTPKQKRKRQRQDPAQEQCTGNAAELLENGFVPEDMHGDDASAWLDDADELDYFDNFDEDGGDDAINGSNITAAGEEEEEGLRPLESGDRYGYR